MSILKTVASALSDGFGTVDEVGAYGDVTGFIDTGSYALNALVSGSIFGGFPSNKIVGIAGEKSTGKTFYAIQTIKGFLDANPKAECLIFDDESAITSDQLSSRGIDISRVAVEPVATVEEFRTKCMNVLTAYKTSITPYLKKNKWKAPPPALMIVLDSLGNLSTNKEVTDISDGNDKRDMTKQQLLKGAFRVLTIECGKLNVPMICTAHTYSQIGAYIPTQVVGGGTGMQYAASIILAASKSYEKGGKDDKVTIGSVIKFVTEKSRMTRERQKVETLLRYDGGIDRYYGLLNFVLEMGELKKVAKGYEWPNGEKVSERSLINEPAKHFTPLLLERIDEWCGKRFKYVSDFVAGSEEDTVDVEPEGHEAGVH